MIQEKKPERLIFLNDLRRQKEPKYAHKDMALFFKLTGRYAHQTVGKWERGEAIPSESKHRPQFIYYLWNELQLRRDSTQFEEKWKILVEEWEWAPLAQNERGKLNLQIKNDEIDAQPTHKPDQTSSYTRHFVGRQHEIAEIVALLAPQSPDQTHIVALVGMAGIGKTTLSAYIAHHLKEQFQDGILWARVSTNNPLDILQSWAQAYGYDFSTISSLESRAAAVRSMLADKQTLIVLDDVGSLEVGQLLLPSGADCSVLITTRNQDIGVALNARCVDLPKLTTHQSMDLLISTLGENRIVKESEAAQTICEILDHLPLAVEIIAQRLASRPRQKLSAIVERLNFASFRLDLSISDRAVRTSFLVSWDGLNGEQQRIFTLMGVFEGRSFGIGAFAHVAELNPALIADHLMDLAALSLVGEDGERYRQHLLLADFAREKLAEVESIDETTPALRMAEYFLILTQENQMNYAVLDPELEDIMFGMGTAHRLEAWQLVLDYADDLTKAWFTRAEYSRARQGFEWAVESAQMLKYQEIEAYSLYHWGHACIEQGDYDEASSILDQGLQIGYHIEADEIIADIQFQQARISIECSNYQGANLLLEDCKEIRSALDDITGIAAVTYWQGFIAYRYGESELARTRCLDASYTQEQEGDDLGQLHTLRLLADIELKLKNIDQALSYGQQAMDIAQTLQDRGEYAAALFSLGKAHRNAGNLKQATHMLEESLILFQHMGSKIFHAFVLFELGKIKKENNDMVAAIDYIEQSISQIRLLRDKSSLVVALSFQGDLFAEIDDFDSACKIWTEALAMAIEQDHPYVAKLRKYLQENQRSQTNLPIY